MTAEGNQKTVEPVPSVDPWGLRRIERLLGGLDGVTSLKIVPDGSGGIDEVHVLSSSDLSPKQIVRNVESALLAEFGLQVDHRKISVARLRPGPDISAAPVEAEEPAAEEAPGAVAAAAPAARRFVLEGIEIERRAGKQAVCRVQLRNGGGEDYTGEAQGPDFERARLDVASTAALRALRSATGDDVSLTLDGVSRVELFGRSLVVAVVHGAIGRRKASLSGIAVMSDSPEEAAVHACLHATNRWLAEP